MKITFFAQILKNKGQCCCVFLFYTVRYTIVHKKCLNWPIEKMSKGMKISNFFPNKHRFKILYTIAFKQMCEYLQTIYKTDFSQHGVRVQDVILLRNKICS